MFSSYFSQQECSLKNLFQENIWDGVTESIFENLLSDETYCVTKILWDLFQASSKDCSWNFSIRWNIPWEDFLYKPITSLTKLNETNNETIK